MKVDFGGALAAMRAGQAVLRPAWHSIRSVQLSEVASQGEGAIPCLVGRAPSGASMFWSPSMADLLAEDWEVVESG